MRDARFNTYHRWRRLRIAALSDAAGCRADARRGKKQVGADRRTPARALWTASRSNTESAQHEEARRKKVGCSPPPRPVGQSTNRSINPRILLVRFALGPRYRDETRLTRCRRSLPSTEKDCGVVLS